MLKRSLVGGPDLSAEGGRGAVTDHCVAVARRQGSTWAVQIEDLDVVFAPTLSAAQELAMEREAVEMSNYPSFFYVVDGRLDRLSKRQREPCSHLAQVTTSVADSPSARSR